MSKQAARLFVVDQSLRSFDGHHFEYDLAVVKASMALGLTPSIIANREFTDFGAFPARVVPWFSKSSSESQRSRLQQCVFRAIAPLPPAMRHFALGGVSGVRRLISGRRAAQSAGPPPLASFGGELEAVLREQSAGPDDHVLVHTFANAELHALVATLSGIAGLPHVHLVLRRDAEEAGVAVDPWGGMAAALAAIGSNSGLEGRLHLYADTAQLSQQYNDLFGSERVTCLPIPHCLGEIAPSPPSGRELRLVYLGNARTEKGYDLLPGMVEALAAEHFATGRVRLVAQSNMPPSLEEGRVAKSVAALAAFPQGWVELLGEELSPEAFQRVLVSADIVLLPYRADLYRRRSSGILVQAAVAGKPVVLPAGSWLESEATPGSAVVFAAPADFADAVRRAVEQHPALRRAAEAGAPAMRQRHSARRLVQLLLEAAGSP